MKCDNKECNFRDTDINEIKKWGNNCLQGFDYWLNCKMKKGGEIDV